MATRKGGRSYRLGACVALLWISGCCSERDVSRQAPHLIGYRPGVTYRLKHEAVLVEGNGPYQMFLERPGGPGVKLIAPVAAGTTFRVERIVRNDCAAPVQGEHWVDTLGVIVGGPLDGWPIAVKLSSVEWVRGGSGQAFASLWTPDAEFVEEPGTAEERP